MSFGEQQPGGFPFPRIDAPRHLFIGATHGEALARFEFLVECQRSVGLITGPAGTGKSTVLRAFTEDCRALRRSAVLVDMTELGAGDFLERMAGGLAVTSRAAGAIDALWHEVGDALGGRRGMRRPCVVLLDHVDRAQLDAQHAVRRLLAIQGAAHAATFLLAFSGGGLGATRDLRQSADLRIPLAPLPADETAEFVRSFLEWWRTPPDALDSEAAQAIFRVTAGMPRDIARVCEFSLLSALRDHDTRISRSVVESAVRELGLLRSSA